MQYWKPRRISTVRLLAGVLTVVLALAVSEPVEAKWASLVMDARTGEVLHEENADTRNYPASLTKMMTLYMVFDALRDGRLNHDSLLEVSRKATGVAPSRLGLKEGETIAVRDAILALVTKSANDVAVVIAEALGGSEEEFARMMTRRAQQLGMSRTTFGNASGLPHRGQLSTARDMATLATRLLTDYPDYYRYFSTWTFRYKGQTYKNHNKLLVSYAGTDGIKTGYIRASGFNLVASAKRGEHRLIGVIFGGRSPTERNNYMKRILDAGFKLVGAPEQEGRQRTASGRYGVQVGAFGDYSAAFETARDALDKAPSHLAGSVVKVVPLNKKDGGKLYRARVLGVGKRDSYRACRVLKQKRMNCMVLKLSEREYAALMP